MRCRKQIGLVALGFGFLHAIYTLITSLRYTEIQDIISSAVNEVQQYNHSVTMFLFKEHNTKVTLHVQKAVNLSPLYLLFR